MTDSHGVPGPVAPVPGLNIRWQADCDRRARPGRGCCLCRRGAGGGPGGRHRRDDGRDRPGRRDRPRRPGRQVRWGGGRAAGRCRGVRAGVRRCRCAELTSLSWRQMATGWRPASRCCALPGSIGPILTAERTALNLLCHLSGVATLTRRWVDAIAGTRPRSATPARPRPDCGRWRSTRCAAAAGQSPDVTVGRRADQGQPRGSRRIGGRRRSRRSARRRPGCRSRSNATRSSRWPRRSRLVPT